MHVGPQAKVPVDTKQGTVAVRVADGKERQYTGWPKKWHHFLYALSSSNINRFSKFFLCQNQEKIYNSTITKDPTTPQVCRYTTL